MIVKSIHHRPNNSRYEHYSIHLLDVIDVIYPHGRLHHVEA